MTLFWWNSFGITADPYILHSGGGAVIVQNGDRSVMVKWTYDDVPYLVSGGGLYDDLIVAYHNGAEYVVIVDYPETDYSECGILTEEHFDALEEFWNYLKDNLRQHGTIKAEVAHVLPENYGFDFLSAEDKIWGLWSADTDARSEKIWCGVNQLMDEYGFSLDIICQDPKFNPDLQRHYERVIFWKESLNQRVIW